MVYQATDTLTGEEVAIKESRVRPAKKTPGGPDGPRFDVAAVHEISFLKDLAHSQILKILDAGFILPKSQQGADSPSDLFVSASRVGGWGEARTVRAEGKAGEGPTSNPPTKRYSQGEIVETKRPVPEKKAPLGREGADASAETEVAIFEVLEKMDRSLQSAQVRNEPLFKRLTRQILLGLNHLHSYNVVHRDLKPGNLLANQALTTVKLADLGLAETLWTPRLRSAGVGTPSYLAPELLLPLYWGHSKTLLSTKIDLWALGLTLYQLWTGQFLFNLGDVPREKLVQQMLGQLVTVFGSEPINTLSEVLGGKPVSKFFAGRGEAAKRFPGLDSELFLDLLDRLLRINPVERISAREALAHPFLASPIEELQEMDLSGLLPSGGSSLRDGAPKYQPVHLSLAS